MNNLQNNTSNNIVLGLLFGKLLPYVIVLLMVVVLGVGYYLWNIPPQEQEKDASELEREALERDLVEIVRLYDIEGAPEGPTATTTNNYGLNENGTRSDITGNFIFSGYKLASTDPTQPYYVSLDSDEPNFNLVQIGTDFGFSVEYKDPLKPSDLFVFTSSDFENSLDPDNFSVFEYEADSDTLTPLTSAIGLDQKDIAYTPTTELLAYGRLIENNDYVDHLRIDNSEVVVVDTEQDIEIGTVTGAAKPQWSPDGTKLLFFGRDGLYLFPLETNETELVIPVKEGSEIIATSMFDLSSDGKYLVWTTGKEGLITMFEITNWDEFAYQELGRIQVLDSEFYRPRFSPDGKHYAVQAISRRLDDVGNRINPRLEIRATLGREILLQYDLDEFDFDALFNDDWVFSLN